MLISVQPLLRLKKHVPTKHTSRVAQRASFTLMLFTGVHGNYLRSSIKQAGLDPDNLPESNPSMMDFRSGAKSDAKAWKNIWGSGQGIGAIQSVESTRDYIDRLYFEYHNAKGRICGCPYS